MIKKYSPVVNKVATKTVLASLLGLVIAVLLAACGGGGGGGIGVGAAQATVVQGTITGFGSIFVNGVEFSTTSAQVTFNDAPGQVSALQIGQRVSVTGQRNSSTTGTATQITYDPELEGQISAIDVANSRLTVLGQTVEVSGTTVFRNVANFAALAVGNFVEVSGRRDSTGLIRAGYVELRNGAPAQLEVRGVVASVNTSARTFVVGAQAVNYANATLQPSTLTLQNGQLVEVNGSLAGGVLNATRVQAEDESIQTAEDNASIEGLVSRIVSSTQFVLNGTTVQVGANTRYVNGTVADIAVNTALEVEGSVDANRVLQAATISFEHAAGVRVTADVQAINAAARTVTLLGGIVIAVNDQTRIQDKRGNVQPFGFGNLVVGDHLEIAAASINNQLVATRLERVAASTAVELRAPVTSSNAINFTLLLQGVTADLTNAQFRDTNDAPLTLSAFLAAATPGTTVDIRGTFDSLVINASRAELENPDD